MAKMNFRKNVKKYYERHSLSEAKLNDLEAMLSSSSLVFQKRTFFQKLAPFSVVASVFVMMVSLFVLFQTGGDIRENIANEVAQNHLKMRPLEVSSNQFSDLKKYFTELNFVLVNSDRLDLTLLKGARYCSIKGKIAAQIRLKDLQTHQRLTHYQVAYDAKLYGPMPDVGKGEIPITLSQKGLLVSMWVERGLLMVNVKE